MKARHVSLGLSLLVFSVCGAARAQRAPETPCGESELVDPWTGGDVGLQAISASRELDGSIELCSTAVGIGPRDDGYRYLTSEFEGDFFFEAMVTEIEPGGRAGLIAFGPNVARDAARAAIELVADGAPGSARVRSSVRIGQGGAADAWPDEALVSLPVTLRIRRVDGMLRTEFEDADGLHLQLTTSVANSALDHHVKAGMFQASGDESVPRRAWFARPSRSEPEPKPEIDCVEPRAMLPGSLITLQGENMSSVRGASFAGVDATVVRASDESVTLQLGRPARAGLQHGELVVESSAGSLHVAGGVSFTGTPYIRGDATGDGKLTREDFQQICYQVHRSKPLACPASGDVDGDGDVDDDDLMRLKRYVRTGSTPPVAPFPQAGYASGALSCGLPAGPTLGAISDERGRKISRALAQGDIVMLDGAAFDAPNAMQVYFGDVPMNVLATSTSSRLMLQVGTVPSAGVRCPVLWRTPLRGANEARFGQAFTVDQASGLCADFAPSRLSVALTSTVERDRVVLSAPRASWPAGQRVTVDAAYFLPFVDGQARGPRSVRMQVTLPSGRDAYEQGMELVAAELSKALQGDNEGACDCELQVIPNAVEGTLTIAPPCIPLPPPPPDPNLPGLPNGVKAPKSLTGHLDVLQNPNVPAADCDVEHDYETDPLAWSWCQFAEMVLPPENAEDPYYEQFPYFESFVPAHVTLSDSYDKWVVDPLLKRLSEKAVLHEPVVHYDMRDLGYDDGCDFALRNARCIGFESVWMPRFSAGGRVVKPFWIGQSEIPPGLDVSGLYNWMPANDNDQSTLEERQYLVGLHINVAHDAEFGDDGGYFQWITAYVPLPVNQDAPHYNETCTTGTAQKRPLSLAGTPFASFVICNPDVAGQGACGNPWADMDECSAPATQGCVGCHKSMGSTNGMNAAWLTGPKKYVNEEIMACEAQLALNPMLQPNWGGAAPGHTNPWPQLCDFGGQVLDQPRACYQSAGAEACESTPDL